MVHALLVERIERAALADYQAMVAAKVARADVEITPPGVALEQFEASLAAEPVQGKEMDPEQAALRRALGV